MTGKKDCRRFSKRLKPEELEALKSEFSDAVYLSAIKPQDVADLRLRLIGYFETDMKDDDIFIPYATQGAIGEIRSKMRVISESYNEKGTTLHVRGHQELIQRIRARFGL